MPYKSTRELPKQVQSLPEATAGLNATGESDIRNYYDRIKSDQETRLQPALRDHFSSRKWLTETRLAGWGGRTRTQKCQRKISA
jgi:hypothetical protein